MYIPLGFERGAGDLWGNLDRSKYRNVATIDSFDG